MTNMQLPATTSVVIAGAGPVGLALALELGLLGIDTLVIEKRDGAVTVPKQTVVSARNMEFCRRWGVAEQVRKAVWPENYPRDFVYLENLRGRELHRVKVPPYAARSRADITPEVACPCPQIYFDPILIARVRALPSVALRYSTRLDGFSQDADGVTAKLSDATGGRQSVRARYLVGCDGPTGLVRETLGIALGGLGVVAMSLNIYFRSMELPAIHDEGWARFYRVIDETGCWAELIPIDGRELWRLTVFDRPASANDPHALLRKMAGGDFAYEIIQAQPWERRDFVAKEFGRGRVFIAGDAAHECSPTGGIGMHTGLEEVVNLGWKLTAMVQGWGGPNLLAAYEAERRPMAARNVDLATRSFHAIAAIPGHCVGAPVTSVNANWRANAAALSVPEHLKTQCYYENSPICVEAPEPPQFVASTKPGIRAPHAWLADGRSTLDLFGGGFVLLHFGDAGTAPLLAAAKARGMPLREVAIADAEIAALYERRLVLVRPDGHVAWRADACPADAGAIIDTVRGARPADASVVSQSIPADVFHERNRQAL
jgi:2-polyprenyl-6-methoxyphenol hydroxylase-like FAD-dependent oxidoreductase